jgi:hypothetical protein
MGHARWRRPVEELALGGTSSLRGVEMGAGGGKFSRALLPRVAARLGDHTGPVAAKTTQDRQHAHRTEELG